MALRAGGELRDARGKRAIVPHNRTLAADPAPHGSWRQLESFSDDIRIINRISRQCFFDTEKPYAIIKIIYSRFVIDTIVHDSI